MMKCDNCIHEEYCELMQRDSHEHEECEQYRKDLCDVDFDEDESGDLNG